MGTAPPPQGPPELVGASAIHGFRRGRRPLSLVVLPDRIFIVQTAPALGGVGAAAGAALSVRHQKQLDGLLVGGAPAISEAFPRADEFPVGEIEAVVVEPGPMNQRILRVHRIGIADPATAPFPRKKVSLATLHGALAPLLGQRLHIDPRVAAQG